MKCKTNLLSCLQIAFIILLPPKTILSSARAPSPAAATASYSSGVSDEKWVLEEGFHGASSALDDKHAKRSRKRKRKSETKTIPVNDEIEESHSLEAHHFTDPWWDEDESHEYQLERYPKSPKKNSAKDGKHRWTTWRSRSNRAGCNTSPNNEPYLDKSDTTLNISTSVHNEEHLMRTDEWELDVHLSRLFSKEEGNLFPEFFSDGIQRVNSKGMYRKRQVMKFASNGYVKIVQDRQITSNNINASFVTSPPTTEQQRKIEVKVGKWRIGHSGVAFDIPVRVCLKNMKPNNPRSMGDDPVHQTMTVLHYRADLHLNKFGDRPRMTRGVITRDRYSSILPSNFLRPVIGTFSAEGIGHDTVDTSYKVRGFGLSRQQSIQERLCSEKQTPP